jgi:hypothetical protein
MLWEYAELVYNFNQSKSSMFWIGPDRQPEQLASDMTTVSALNRAGRDGWELVASRGSLASVTNNLGYLMSIYNDGVIYTFKRLRT